MKLGELKQFILNTEEYINKKRYPFQRVYKARYSNNNLENKIKYILRKTFNNRRLTKYNTYFKLYPFLFVNPSQIIYCNDYDVIIGMNIQTERRTFQYYIRNKKKFKNINTIRRLKIRRIKNNVLQQVVASCVNENSYIQDISGRATVKSNELIKFYKTLPKNDKIIHNNFRISYPLLTLDFYGEGIKLKHIKEILLPLLEIYQEIHYNIEFTLCHNHKILFGRWIRVRSEFFTMWFKPRNFRKTKQKSIRKIARLRINNMKKKNFENYFDGISG